MASSKSVVFAALIANGAIAILKGLAFVLTQSPAMLSETFHSISDTGNQVFLLFGIRFSEREASDRHPFGYGKAQFFYSFLVSVLLFGIAGWESAKHGYHALTSGHSAVGGTVTVLGETYPAVYVSYVVLAGAFVFESWALYKANQGMTAQIEERGWSGYREAFQKTSDVTTLTAFTEDTIAITGIVLAFAGIALTELTHNPLYDALSALLIGLMLMGFALALAWENKRLLLGESMAPGRVDELREIVTSHDGVTGIVDFRTVYFGPERAIVAADVAFDPDLDTDEIDRYITAIEDRLMEAESHIEKVYVEPETQAGSVG